MLRMFFKNNKSIKVDNNTGIIITGDGNSISSIDSKELESLHKKIDKLTEGNKEIFLKEYFGNDWEKAFENNQTYLNLKIKLANTSSIEELLREKRELQKKIESQRLNSSIQNIIDKAFTELRYEDVRDLLDHFIESNKNIEKDLINAHYQKALTYIQEYDYHRAINEFEEFIPLGIKDVYILHDYGFIYFIHSIYEKSLKMYEKALSLSEDDSIKASIYNSMSAIYYALDKNDIAFEYIKKALSLYREDEIDFVVATTYDTQGILLSQKGQYEEALDFFFLGLSLRENFFGEESLEVSASIGNIGLTYHHMGEYKEALKLHKLDLTIKKKVLDGKLYDLLGHTYLNIGLVYHDIKEYKEAIFYSKEALNIYLKVLGENNDSTALAYNNLYSSYNNLEEYDKAYINLVKAIEIWNDILPQEHYQLKNAKEEFLKIKMKSKKD